MSTVFESLLTQLASASEYNTNDQVAPAVILWPDKEAQWAPLVSRLRAALPHFLTLGEYDPDAKTGPAIWLRCMIARTVPQADWADDAIPILYLPGYSRQDLRAVESCPEPLKPLAELQYRGVIWSQLNARDWTIIAFLQTKDGGLGLDVAKDAATLEAMGRALGTLAVTPVADLRGRRLQAEDFDELLNPDAVRHLLLWMDDPDGTRGRWDTSIWASFRNVCKEKYGFDPETDGALTAGEKLGNRAGAWQAVWRRFAEAPTNYPDLPDLLRRAKPQISIGGLFADADSWPQDNEAMEAELRDALSEMHLQTPADARALIHQLEAKHGQRRRWVWAAFNGTPLANALAYLVVLAEKTSKAHPGDSASNMGCHYVRGGWEADAAVLDALATVEKAIDVAAVKIAVTALYRDWLDDSARRFQEGLRHDAYVGGEKFTELCAPQPGRCLLFADGLRYDVAMKLEAQLRDRHLDAFCHYDYAALPTVTATAKAAAAPIAPLLTGNDAGTDFTPSLKDGGQPLTTDRFRQLLATAGFQVLVPDETGDPSGAAWTECGSLDKAGHDQYWKIAHRIREEVTTLRDRVQALLDAGWREVVVLTDHGWLMLPDALPKAELKAYLTDTLWGRCAVLKPASDIEYQTVPWHWNNMIQIAIAPGISSFIAGKEYAHGGVSLQECVVPVLFVKSLQSTGTTVTIESVKWSGMRCRVQVTDGSDLMVDIRTKAGDSDSSVVTGTRPIGSDGATALVVDDDSLEGTAAFVVVLSADGHPLVKVATTVGE